MGLGELEQTNNMEQIPSLEVDRFSTSHKISHILWNLKFYYCIHKILSPVPVLSQINPVNAPSIPLHKDPF